MKRLKSIYFLLFIFLLSKLKCSNKYNKEMNFVIEFNDTYKKKTLYENYKYLKNDDNYIFKNSPREKNDSNPTFEILNNGSFISWPNDTYNNNSNFNNCSIFLSIISFEFDEDNNIYLLDEGNKYINCPINLYKFNSEGHLLNKYNIYERYNQNISLNDFVIDKINNYFYIPFTNFSVNEYKVGIFVREIDKKEEEFNAKTIILNDKKFLFEEKYNLLDTLMKFNNSNELILEKKIINIALSCDGKYLLLCPLSSRMIYSVATNKIRDLNSEISFSDVKEAYKNDASSALISSNMGNLYLTGLEQNIIYMAGQIDYDLSIFDFKILDKIGSNDIGYPTKLYITDGNLYIIYKNIINENISNNIDINNNIDLKVNTKIYQIEINKEKSYIYKCGGLGYKWNWKAYIVWGIFSLIFILILTFVFIANWQDQYINKKNN